MTFSDKVSAALDSFNAVKLCAIQDPRCFMLADKTARLCSPDRQSRHVLAGCTGGDPWGAPPAFGAPSPQGGGGGGGGNPWGAPAPGGAPSPGGSSVGAKPAPSWPATKESDPFGDLVTLRK